MHDNAVHFVGATDPGLTFGDADMHTLPPLSAAHAPNAVFAQRLARQQTAPSEYVPMKKEGAKTADSMSSIDWYSCSHYDMRFWYSLKVSFGIEAVIPESRSKKERAVENMRPVG